MQNLLQRFHFQVQWGEDVHMNFSIVSGLKFRTQVIEYRGGQDLQYSTVKLPGRTKYDNIILKRGAVEGDISMYQWWRKNSLFNDNEKRTIAIKLLNDKHEPVLVWLLENAWPVSISYADLDANADTIMIESMELAFDSMAISE